MVSWTCGGVSEKSAVSVITAGSSETSVYIASCLLYSSSSSIGSTSLGETRPPLVYSQNSDIHRTEHKQALLDKLSLFLLYSYFVWVCFIIPTIF